MNRPNRFPSTSITRLASSRSSKVTKKSSAFAPDKYQDHYQTALKQLVQDKVKGRKIVAPHEEARPKGTNVVDLMAALKKSVGEASPAKKAAASESKPAAKKASPKGKKKAS